MKTNTDITLHGGPARLLILLLLILALLSSAVFRPAAPAQAAASTLTVRLGPLGGSPISGTVTLSALGRGTRLAWHVRGLAPRSTIFGSLHAGTCALPSASARVLAILTADAAGRAAATTTVRFSLPYLADGQHILMLRAAACGRIPVL